MTVATKRNSIGSFQAPNSTVERSSEASNPNAALDVGLDTGKVRRIVLVAVRYSDVPTQTGVVITLDSGLGPEYDIVLNPDPAADAQETVYSPNRLLLADDDTIRVLAPEGGEGITSYVSVYSEVLG